MALPSAVAEEGVRKVFSYISTKVEDKASRADTIARLEIALARLDIALEKTGRIPVIYVSLLRSRKDIKGVYMEGTELLNKHKKPQNENDGHVVVRSSSYLQWIADRAANFSISSLVGLGKEKKEARGTLFISLRLRISEDTNIIGMSIKCIQRLTSQFKLVAECAIGELTLLPNLQDTFHSYVLPPSSINEICAFYTEFLRPDPICCNGNSCGTLASKSSIEIPEPVTRIYFSCYNSAPKNNLRNAPLVLHGVFAPHVSWYSNDVIRIEFGGKREWRNGSVQQLEEIARSDALDYLVHEPEPTDYALYWFSPHGIALVTLRAMPRPSRRVEVSAAPIIIARSQSDLLATTATCKAATQIAGLTISQVKTGADSESQQRQTRFYRKAYNEQFSGVTTEQEPESSTNTPEWVASVLNASFEIARIVQGPGVPHPWISCCIGHTFDSQLKALLT
ncbi:unnamed protein product [Miscanthus lutarioriparius]|uniref:Uncharacterized protein n=1 Tax=Miscanthus lutarioriparius TaxID=422564 RepID=A0A811SQS3_9POAL|nr:unnamed protein product [Miscanthus lutarioriparius]